MRLSILMYSNCSFKFKLMLIYCFKGSNINCNSKCNKDEYDGRINYELEREMRCCYMNSTAWGIDSDI